MLKSLLLMAEIAGNSGDPKIFSLAILTSSCVGLILEACYSCRFTQNVSITRGCDEEPNNFFNHDQATCHDLLIFSLFEDRIMTITIDYI